MPKAKTVRSAAKRFKVSKSGKVTYRQSGMAHLRSKKRAGRKRRLRTPGQLGGKAAKTARALVSGG